MRGRPEHRAAYDAAVEAFAAADREYNEIVARRKALYDDMIEKGRILRQGWDDGDLPRFDVV